MPVMTLGDMNRLFSGRRGTFTCNGTSAVTVANSKVTANSVIVVTLKTVGGTVGAVPSVKTITAGTGFTISGTASDTSVYNYVILGQKMEYIATDSATGYKWYYADGWYYQRSGDVVLSKLSAKNFPDPFDVWDKKIKSFSLAAGRELAEAEKEGLKPRGYVFSIWEHRNANYNN